MKKCELLVPAGGEKQFIAAVENGADAVYIGGPLFNARMNAENFTADEISKATDYAHLRNVKVYVTMNTLLRESELDSALGLAEILYEKGVDALIVQDLGLGRMIKKRMPDFPLHLSTQATVYNRTGAEAAAGLGYERVVLARELSLEQIRECSLPDIIETEVFVHGALCFCYSGQCQMSRFIGGRSGNKGCCAQPCRLPYSAEETQVRERYPLSPKDLCLIDSLGSLVEAGVSSLKIEGRMKSAEYVAIVTGIYRKYLDQYYEEGKYEVTPEDRQALMQIFNRGGFTEGYIYEDPKDKLMSGLLPKNQGVRAGQVINSAKNGLMADVDLTVPLEMGDIVEIHGREFFSTKITYIEKLHDRKNAVRIGDMKSKVRPGDMVYRIVSSALMKKAEETFSSKRLKTPVEMTFRADWGKPAELTVSCPGKDGKKISVKSVCKDVIPQEPRSRATSDDEIAAQLSKTGSTAFSPGKIRIIKEQPFFMPVSEINRLRRQALAELSAAKTVSYRRKLPAACDYPTGEKSRGCMDRERFIEFYFISISDFERADKKRLIGKAKEAGACREQIRFILPLREMAENILAVLLLDDDLRSMIIPFIPNVTAGPCDRWLRENLPASAELVRNFGGRLYVGNISWIKPFADEGITVMGDFGLNITNGQSAEAYKSLGMSGYYVNSLEETDKSCGAYPLMVTEHSMKDCILKDRKGMKYSVSFDSKSHKTLIRKAVPDVDWNRIRKLWKETTDVIRIYL